MSREEQLVRVILRLAIAATVVFFLSLGVVWWSSYQGRVDLRDQIVRGCEIRNRSGSQGRIARCRDLYKPPTLIQLH